MKEPITVAKYDLEGNYLETLEATHMADLARQVGDVDQNSLSRAIKNVTLSCEGFQYKLVDPHVKTPRQIGEVWHLSAGKVSHKHEQLIGKYYNNTLITTYVTQQEAAEKNQLDISTISRCLSGEYAQSGGFVFKYLS